MQKYQGNDKQGKGGNAPSPQLDDDVMGGFAKMNLPVGGGAIQGMGEKFSATPVTGTGAMSFPIPVSAGRFGFGPKLSVSYDSGSGNGLFGFGWNLSIASIKRKTDKELPRYFDHEDSDIFLLLGIEDLVPELNEEGTKFCDKTTDPNYIIHRYRPRIEGKFSRIERWSKIGDAGDVHWRTLSADNILTVYGKDSNSRITSPVDDNKIYSWLVCEGRDDRGNVILYEYKAEDGEGVDLSLPCEQNRGALDSAERTVNRYLKSIRYGNKTPILDDDGQRPNFLTKTDIDDTDWLFQVVFDYGEHDISAPKPNDLGKWNFRLDSFSSFRPGFELRTTRLCQRVLMFHHFPDEVNVGQDCLVRSIDFTYSSEETPDSTSNAIYSFLTSVTNHGYIRDGLGYSKVATPSVEFEYSRPTIQDQIETVDSISLANLPSGIDELTYRWTDLHGEGIPGVLSEQNNGWFYTRNLSPLNEGAVEFGAQEFVVSRPNQMLSSGSRLVDLDGTGRLDLVVLDGPNSGFYRHDQNEGWELYRTFKSRINYDISNPNVKFLDLDGDGCADILVCEDQAFFWHPYRAGVGFGEAERVFETNILDKESRPRLVFADGTESIFLADMNGDGLTDLLRIRNGEVCYWPNMGYGRFGAKVTMTNSPKFDHPDQFNRSRIRLADIDGSGTIDIIYLHQDGVRLYFNQSGNGWSNVTVLNVFPQIDDLAHIVPLDLLGNGTACLVWSSPLVSNAQKPMRFIKLMGEQKPHLLIKTVNNYGAETNITYAPSTKFYLQDKRDGVPWITRLPYPVHVVEKIEAIDWVSRHRYVSIYNYHHGYFDPDEREFRGFAMVEKEDSEAFEDYVVGVERIEGGQELAPELNQPPVVSRTWYHTGAFIDGENYLHQLQSEYYLQKHYLPVCALPKDLSAKERVEGLRALKGLPLRQEVYSFDGSVVQELPFLVVENCYEVKQVQARGKQKYGVFMPVERENITLNFDRDADDPRISHRFSFDLDEYGIPHKLCQVTYGRQIVDESLPEKVTNAQKAHYIAYSEAEFTEDLEQRTPVIGYRLRTPHRQIKYEVTGLSPAETFFLREEIEAKIATASSLRYEQDADGITIQKRLLSDSHTIFLDNELSPMSPGHWDLLGFVYQRYQLAFTPEFVEKYYDNEVTNDEFEQAGYVHFDGDSNWWIPSSIAVYPESPADHFYRPIGAKDPFGVETIYTFDKYELLVEKSQTTQALWNETSVVNDYRVLVPTMITDINKNRASVEVDALGMVVKTAVMGKEGTDEGDDLDDPTIKLEYDLFNWVNNGKPIYTKTLMREKHGEANPRWHESYSYSNGRGNVVMMKKQANPGKAFQVNTDDDVEEVEADSRWVGNGRVILNNKGMTVKQYEPYFSTTHEYESEKALREMGVTKIYYYDAVGRNIRTEFPNGTFAKIEFNSWSKKIFDPNDTVKESQWYVDRGSPNPDSEDEPMDDPERRAAWLAAKHNNTPSITHFDSLGRAVYFVMDFGGGATAATRSEIDFSGRNSKVFDQLEREVSSGFTGMAGQLISSENAEKGKRWSFSNVLGKMVKCWDQYGRKFRVEFDEINRPLSTYVQESAESSEILFNYIVYGDRHSNADQLNLLGTVHQVYDQAGVVRTTKYDFKGNTVKVERILASDYKETINWNILVNAASLDELENDAKLQLDMDKTFLASSEFDAMNRPSVVLLPDSTVITPTYNLSSNVESLKAQIHGKGDAIEFLKSQDHDAKGRRLYSKYGNDVITKFFYDPFTFRLRNLLTYQAEDEDASDSLQDIDYTFDPSGNVTQICDNAQSTHYFNNDVIKAENLYQYDAVYQLISASGREHAGLGNDTIRTNLDIDFVAQLPHENDSNAIRNYVETYEYDVLGNIKKFRHSYKNAGGTNSEWTRHYRYSYEEDASVCTNRLNSNSIPGDSEAGPYGAKYTYDNYGNMMSMGHLSDMSWDFMDCLQRVDLGGGGTAFYVYDSGGQRIRKIIERLQGKRTERIYLGAVEFYSERINDEAPHLERWTLHIADQERIAQVDLKTKDENNSDPDNPLNVLLIRYQYTNHLGSTKMETDPDGIVISYEEYQPYGTSAYRSGKPGYNLSLKRYRFSGKELDDETGLYYFGSRYYAPWLARWTSADPAGHVDGLNLYRYCRNGPISYEDPSGTDSKPLDTYFPGSTEDRLWPESSFADRVEFVRRHGYKMIEPHPEQQQWEGTREKGCWVASPEAKFELITSSTAEGPPAPTPSPPSGGDPPSSPPSGPAPEAPSNNASAGPPAAAAPAEEKKSSRWGNFFKGVAVGLAVTVLVVAVVATGGAALAAIAPGAAAALGASGVGTALAVGGTAVGAGLFVGNTVQSLRQRDLMNNPISQEQADYNLGVGVGSLAAGPLAKPIAGAGAALGRGTVAAMDEAAAEMVGSFGGRQLALEGGGVWGGAVPATSVAGVTTTQAAGLAGAGGGATIMAMAGHEADWTHTSGGEKVGEGRVRSGSDVPPGRRLTWPEQLTVHTERKILAKLKDIVKPGDTISIKGTKPPCNPGGRGCQSAMKLFASENNVTIEYTNTTTGQTWTFQ